MILEPGYIVLTLVIMAMAGLASQNVKSTFTKYSQVPIRRRMTGYQTARHILDANGLHDVQVEAIQGELTDHYDPRKKVVRLSQPVYGSTSLSAVGVAAHEVGHAIQDQQGYTALKMRQGLFPIAAMGAQFGSTILMLAVMMVFMGPRDNPLVAIMGIAGLGLYSMAVLMHVVTLPVEFNASSRAMAALSQHGIINQEEYRGTKKVLNAAALTYVAQAVGAILMLLYYVMIIFGNRR